MTDFLLLIVGLIWLVGICLRVYRHARFYQIEEYMSRRYLRWLLAARARWLPGRPVIAWVIGSALSVLMAEAPGSLLSGIIASGSAVVAVWPPPRGEIKKPFRATPRAKRMLGAAFVIAALLLLPVAWYVSRLLGGAFASLPFAAVGFIGLVLLLAAPLLLIAGNVAMTPAEAWLRRRFIARARRTLGEIHLVVIGITGSYGKTSTKQILAHLLQGRYKVYATPKSYNTLMGICLAINNDLAEDRSAEYFIAEMGAYVPGEIERIADLTRPTIGIEIEVGPQHLERFGSLDNIARAKYELIKALPPGGVGVFNRDNPYIREMVERGYPETCIAVSRETADGARFVASDIEETLGGLNFTVTDTETEATERFETPLLGLHNVTNILLATAVAVHEGMTLREIARRARTLQSSESRLARQTTAQGITIINDAYSANPAGAASALRVLGLHQSGRRLLITPGMVELGPLMESENGKLGEAAAAHATDVILVGPKQTEPIKQGLLGAGFPAERLLVVETLAESIQWYENHLSAGDTVLFLNDLPDTYGR